MQVKPMNVFFAVKAIGLRRDLSSSEKTVAVIIIEHFNRRTGRCDPGVERLAFLSGLDRSSVLRSIAVLDRKDIIWRTRHGGRSQKNSYEPNWSGLAEWHATWCRRFANGEPASVGAVAVAPPAESQNSDLCGGGNATQTCSNNLKNEPEAGGDASAQPRRPSPARSSNGSGRRGMDGPARTVSSSEAAFESAKRRLSLDIQTQYAGRPDVLELIWSSLDAELEATATRAEMQHKGAGLRLVLDRLSGRLP